MIDLDYYPDGIEITLKIRGGLDFTSESSDSPEYHIVLSTSGSDPQPRICYYLTKFKGKSRQLSRFENSKLLEKLRVLRLQVPEESPYVTVIMADPPSPWYQLLVRLKGMTLEMSWDSGEVDDGANPNTANDFVELIEEIEPLDYEGLGVMRRMID